MSWSRGWAAKAISCPPSGSRTASSGGRAARCRTCRRAQSIGIVGAHVERRRSGLRWRVGSGMVRTIGQSGIIGSPSKYIWVMSRWAKPVAEDREVDVRRAPVVDAVGPGIGAGLDGAEDVAAVVVGDGAAAAAEIGIERRRGSPPSRGGSGRRHWPARTRRGRRGPAAPLSSSTRPWTMMRWPMRALAGLGEIVDQVVVELADDVVAELRAGDLGDRVGERDQRLLRRARAPCSCSRARRRADARRGRARQKAPVSGAVLERRSAISRPCPRRRRRAPAWRS